MGYQKSGPGGGHYHVGGLSQTRVLLHEYKLISDHWQID